MIPCERAYSSDACPNEAEVMVRMHSKYVEMVRPFCQTCALAAVATNDGNGLQFQILGPILSLPQDPS